MYGIRSNKGHNQDGIRDLRSARSFAKDIVGWDVGTKVEIMYEGKTIQTVEIVPWAGQTARKWIPSGQNKPLAALLAN